MQAMARPIANRTLRRTVATQVRSVANAGPRPHLRAASAVSAIAASLTGRSLPRGAAVEDVDADREAAQRAHPPLESAGWCLSTLRIVSGFHEETASPEPRL